MLVFTVFQLVKQQGGQFPRCFSSPEYSSENVLTVFACIPA